MLDKIRVLQLGNRDWSRSFRLPENVSFYYMDTFESAPKKPYDIVFIERGLLDEELAPLHKATKAYTLFVVEGVELTSGMAEYYACKKGKRLAESDIQSFLQQEVRNFFPKPYGEKFLFRNLSIAHGFSGSVVWSGNHSVTMEGDYGGEFNQIVFWRNNIPLFQGQAIDLWLEYEKDSNVEIMLSVTQFVQGSISEIQQKWEFTEEELDEVVVIDNQQSYGTLFVSLHARGSGKLKLVALHDRYSRRGHGAFLPGGERMVASNREEVFCYFDPGDRKPPLNVYFSGYKTMQGFEGYNMMRNKGCPFLLIAEPRLEGGCFYMGSEEYEGLIRSAILRCMAELGFSREQVILSGLSMGTYGALYYGCDIMPHSMILGKPLASIGDVAANERLHRPGGFPTSLDVLNYLCKGMDASAVESLNHRFWDKFDTADWRKSRFIVAYMIEDDYDSTAYDTLISHLRSDGVQVYGKGIHGRHNDATGAIVGWFSGQFDKVLSEDFSRRIEK